MENKDDIILQIGILYQDLPELKYHDYNDYPTSRIGGGNPNYKCKYCGRSVPEINMSNKNHSKSCQWVIAQEREHYLKGYLDNEDLKKLENLLDD